MRVLVTGSSGFIGHNLVKKLVLIGHEVIGLDSQIERELFQDPNYKFENGDVRDSDTLSTLINRYRPNLLIHLAAKKIPRYGHRVDTLLVNGIASENIFREAWKADVGVVFASTSDVYGMNPNVPFRHDSNLVSGPAEVARWSYSISKLFSEHLLHGYYEQKENPSTILRFFGAYGPHNSLDWTGGPIPVFIKAALESRPIDIHGDGSQTRTFSYIDDHINALTTLLNDWPLDSLKTFNFGSTTEISVLDLADKVWRLVNKNSEPIFNFVPYKSFGNYQDVMRRVPDMRETIQSLGDHWNTDLENGLIKTIAWQKKVITS